MEPYLKVSKCLLNVRLFHLLLNCSISSRSIRSHHHHHHHHISGVIELLTFAMFQLSVCFVWRATCCGIRCQPRWLPPLSSQSSPIFWPTPEPSSPGRHPPSWWVTALSAIGENVETERVQSHLLFYRLPAFSPRDLIIPWPVERILHKALSHAAIQHINKTACFQTKKQQQKTCSHVHILHTYTNLETNEICRWKHWWLRWCKDNLWNAMQNSVTALCIYCLYSAV